MRYRPDRTNIDIGDLASAISARLGQPVVVHKRGDEIEVVGEGRVPVTLNLQMLAAVVRDAPAKDPVTAQGTGRPRAEPRVRRARVSKRDLGVEPVLPRRSDGGAVDPDSGQPLRPHKSGAEREH